MSVRHFSGKERFILIDFLAMSIREVIFRNHESLNHRIYVVEKLEWYVLHFQIEFWRFQLLLAHLESGFSPSGSNIPLSSRSAFGQTTALVPITTVVTHYD